MSLMKCFGAILAAAVIVLVAMVLAPMTVRAQDAAAASGPTKPPMMAKDADPDWDVTTVKQSDPGEKMDYMYFRGRHLVVHNEAVRDMLRTAYSVQNNQIVGLPDWANTERFDADGVPDVDGQPSMKQFQGLMQKMLEERFGLKVHTEKREMPVFALTVTKGGPKLMTRNTDDPNGGPRRKVDVSSGQISNDFTNTSMPDLALMLLLQVDRPIVDQTGLQGGYDFKLQWTMDESHLTDANAPPGLFTAIQEQLGLKLEPVKAMADVLVIDKVERPGQN